MFSATLALSSSVIVLKSSKETDAEAEFGGNGSFTSVDMNKGEARYTVTTAATITTARIVIFL
jgi:hypothetical protein